MDGTLVLNADGQTIGIRFGMQAIMAISSDGILDTTGKGETEKSFVTASAVSKMAYHGYLNWCLYTDQKAELSMQKFLDLLDSAFAENNNLFSEIVRVFEESKALKKLSEKKMPSKPKAGKK